MTSLVTVSTARLDWDLNLRSTEKFEQYWNQRPRSVLPKEVQTHPKIWLEIGAGTGGFFINLARVFPDTLFVAIERSRMRGKRLLHRASRANLPNLRGVRGNAIAALITEVPTQSVEKIFILYPCPWVRTSQRLNRWYLHPIMFHLYRALKPGGLLVWASDQEFYIREAQYVCEQRYQMRPLICGALAPNEFNHLNQFPAGRTKFEATFQSAGTSCFELIVQKDKELVA